MYPVHCIYLALNTVYINPTRLTVKMSVYALFLQIIHDRIRMHMSRSRLMWNSVPGGLYALPEFSSDPTLFPFYYSPLGEFVWICVCCSAQCSKTLLQWKLHHNSDRCFLLKQCVWHNIVLSRQHTRPAHSSVSPVRVCVFACACTVGA